MILGFNLYLDFKLDYGKPVFFFFFFFLCGRRLPQHRDGRGAGSLAFSILVDLSC